MRSHPDRLRSSAASLLELTLVAAAVALIGVTLFVIVVPERNRAADRAETSRRLSRLREAITEFYGDLGRLPASGAAGLRELHDRVVGDHAALWKGPYVSSTGELEDAWGRPLEYEDASDEESGPQILISSRGPDGVAGNDDDVLP